MELSERQKALFTVLAQPDPPDLPARTHTWRFAGHPARAARWAYLRTAYVMHQPIHSMPEELPSAARRLRDLSTPERFHLRGNRYATRRTG